MNQISAKMILDSIDPRGNRLRTLEIVLPRYILAELNTHRMLSRNSASSRAIPFAKMVKEVQERPFIPYAWQKDHKGMQGTEYIDDDRLTHGSWLRARNHAINEASMLNQNIEVTKQLANRLLEPFMYHKVLVSGTEWDNFFNLRCPEYETAHGIFKSKKDAIKASGLKESEVLRESILDWLLINKGQADIHMMFLAEAIWDATNESTPVELKEGEWHIPYGDQIDIEYIRKTNYIIPNCNTNEEFENYVQQAIRRISVARCARLSYQTLGDNPVIDYEADLKLYDVLAKSGHYSPFEHVARVMTEEEYYKFVKGNISYLDMKKSNINEVITVMDHKTIGWCLNFKGFIQERYLLEQSWKN